jgi:hypothetical protein
VLGDQGEVQASVSHFEAAFKIRKRVAELSGDDPTIRRDLMLAQVDLGLALHRTRNYAPAKAQLRAALALAERASTDDPRDRFVIAQRDPRDRTRTHRQHARRPR